MSSTGCSISQNSASVFFSRVPEFCLGRLDFGSVTFRGYPISASVTHVNPLSHPSPLPPLSSHNLQFMLPSPNPPKYNSWRTLFLWLRLIKVNMRSICKNLKKSNSPLCKKNKLARRLFLSDLYLFFTDSIASASILKRNIRRMMPKWCSHTKFDDNISHNRRALKARAKFCSG